MRTYPLILALAVAACSSPERDPQDPAPVAVAQPPGRDAVYTAARVGPEAFVRALYEAYGADAMGAPPTPGQEPIYGRILNAMIGEDARRAGGEGPTLDWDPVCNCQDLEGLRLDSVAVRESSATQAEADVVFTNAGQSHSQTLTLIKEGPMWRIADVQAPGRPPLSETLMAAIS